MLVSLISLPVGLKNHDLGRLAKASISEEAKSRGFKLTGNGVISRLSSE
jgi:hypothetical protein